MKIWGRELYVDEENITSICKFGESNFYIVSVGVVALEVYKKKILNGL